MALPVAGTDNARGQGVTGPAPGERAGSSLARRGAVLLACLYPPALLATIAAFRFVGERWWVTTVALYLPRVGFAVPLPLLLVALWITGPRRGVWILLGTSIPVLLVLMGFVFPWPARAASGAPSIRVMSYNVNSEIGEIAPLVQEIDRFSPDVLILVEHAWDAMLPPLRERYPTVRVAGQFVIATRFPVKSSFDPEKIHYSGRLRSPRWLEEVIDTPLGPIALFGVHPQSPREGFYALRGKGLRREILSGQGFSEDSEEAVLGNSGLRAAQVADFAAAARQETVPVIIAGDTNLPNLSWLLHRDLAGFQDGFAKAGWGFGYTFPTGHHGPWMRIDRIMASSELRFVHFEVGRSTASDHESVVADLQRAP
jgi:endonuclease/exonuclease/phosphatase (EEP) superfamily protein YafD